MRASRQHSDGSPVGIPRIPSTAAADSLQSAIEAEREQFFVGREAELGHVAAWLAMPAAATRLISLEGMGGIGKSLLLAQTLRLAASHGAATLWIDGEACGRSPAGLLDWLESAVTGAMGRPAAATDGTAVARLAAEVGRGRRVVLGIDNYDALSAVEGWLRQQFLSQLPSVGVLVILASRQGISAAWRAEPAWRRRLVSLSLQPFTRAEARDYLGRLGFAEHPASQSALRLAGGHPLALALAAEMLERQPAASASQLSRTVAGQLLREVAPPALHPLLEPLAILPEADEDLLASVLREPVAADRYHTLARLSFVAPAPGGLAMHDVARAHLREDLRQRAPGRYRRLRRRAVAALRLRLAGTIDRTERRRLAAQLLDVCRDALPIHRGFADLSAGAERLIPTALRPEDRPRLHAILERWSLQAMQLMEMDEEHRLFDVLCDRFPDTIRVVRSATGEPLAVTAVVPLHRETARLLEQYRTGAIYLRQCPPAERAALDCAAAAADTYFLLLHGAALDSAEYLPDELTGVAFDDWLAFLGEETRLLGLASNPDINDFAHQIGFRPRPECRAFFGGAPWPFEVGELDLRGRDYGAWVAAFLRAVERQDAARGPVPARQAAAPTPALVAEVRRALAALDRPRRLQSSALTARLGVPGPVLRGRLVDLLTRRSPPAPLTGEDQVLLRTAFLDQVSSREAAAGRLYVSRATFYRRLRGAVEGLAEALLAD